MLVLAGVLAFVIILLVITIAFINFINTSQTILLLLQPRPNNAKIRSDSFKLLLPAITDKV